MDPLSVTASAIAILQLAGSSGQVLGTLRSLRDAPQQLQQYCTEVETLRGELSFHSLASSFCCSVAREANSGTALLVDINGCLHRRRESDGYARVERSITSALGNVSAQVLEFERLIQ